MAPAKPAPKPAPKPTPKPAPKPAAKLARWQCSVCGWIYDPKDGDPDNGVKPGTPFEQIPDTWVCPVCGATKDQFNKLND